MAIAFNKPFIPLDGNIERVIKRLLNLKLPKEITKDNLVKSKKILGNSTRASDYAQAIMELGALICRPKNPLCYQCPLIKNCKSFKKKDFEIIKGLYKKFGACQNVFELETMINYVSSNNVLLSAMDVEIKKNSK